MIIKNGNEGWVKLEFKIKKNLKIIRGDPSYGLKLQGNRQVFNDIIIISTTVILDPWEDSNQTTFFCGFFGLTPKIRSIKVGRSLAQRKPISFL